MKILEIIRKKHEVLEGGTFPFKFTVGESPVADSPAVKSIVLYDQGAYSSNTSGNMVFKGYKGQCYLVSFVDSPFKRIIPANTVVDIAVDSEPDKKATKVADADDASAEASALGTG
jgi:hypothetical protein